MKIGRYEVVRRLGTGGMGEVLLARLAGEAGFVTWFALKRLKPEGATGRRSESDLIREARIGGLLNHANVVRIHELLRVDGEFVLVMEYVDGVDLERVLDLHWQRQRPFPPEIAVDVGVQVAEGLHHAHTLVDPEGNPHPLIHRDLKPANVRLSRGGVVKVIDFGIARDRDATSRTAVGLLKGTVRYMSPEQAEGGEQLGTATDIWSAGAILFEMLALKPLHPDLPLADLVDRVQAGKVDDRLDLLPPLPERLRGLVERCLAKRPEDRFASALDLSEALRACRGDLPPGESLARFSERVDREVREWDRQTAAGEGREDPGAEVPADSVINPPTAVGLRLADLKAGANPGPRAVHSLTGVMSREGATLSAQPHAPTVIVQNPRGGVPRGGAVGDVETSRPAAPSTPPAPGSGAPRGGAAGGASPAADPWRDDEFGPRSIDAPAVRDDVDTAREVRTRDILGKRPSSGRPRAALPARTAPSPGGGGPAPAAWGSLPTFGPGSAGAPAPVRISAPPSPPLPRAPSAGPPSPPEPPRSSPPPARLDTGEWEEPLDLPGVGRGRGRAVAMVGAAALALAVMVWAVFFRTPAGPDPVTGLPPASPWGEEAQGPVDGGGGGDSGDPRGEAPAPDAPPGPEGSPAARLPRIAEGRPTVLTPVGVGAADPPRGPPPSAGGPPAAIDASGSGPRPGPGPAADGGERRPTPATSAPPPAADPSRAPPRILHDPQRSAVIGGSPLAFSVTVPGRTGCEVEVIYRVAGGPSTPLRLVPAGGGEYWGSLKVTAAMEGGLSYYVRVRGCGEGSSGSLANPYRVQVL
ncbi:serine/threonine protein kinase [Myxococcota bacterium]|nr:serine/threonine protein kinase [Myxococcota bacterium]